MLKHSLINKGVLNGNNKIMNEAALQPFHLAQPAQSCASAHFHSVADLWMVTAHSL